MMNNRLKKIAALLVAGVMVIGMTLTGCGNSSSGSGGGSAKGMKIFFSTLTLDTFKEMLQNGVVEGGKEAGVTVDVGEECGSVDEQVAQIKQAVDAGYDAIICNPVDATTALQLEVTAGDTPILFVNSQPDEQYLEPDKYMYVGSYDKDAGNFQAEYVWNKLGQPSSMNIVLFQGEPGHPAAGLRTTAVKEYYKKNGIDVTFVFNDTAYWDTAKAAEEFKLFLKTKQPFDAVICNNDSMAVGVVQAMKEVGLDPGKIPVVGVDATTEGCQSIIDGGMQFTVYQSATGQGAAAIQTAIALATKGTAKGIEGLTDDGYYVWVPYEPVDSSNVKDYM